MCIVYETTTTINGQTTKEKIPVECNEKPADKSPEDCPHYKFKPAGSSRKKKGLPSWASSDQGGNGGGGNSNIAKASGV
ncbi:hypothetical protein BDV24DRAFT_146222 [Aspergillus arachidicola]|uniref:Uncharacterized protein n=1 Tax=Aspergillus arachidicola TaxID=656916 RepID=A0A5N6XNE0_9EURO|nr:hypothetical protein BDV24DRAFT_146222 [Aspergillus arachidicola]